MVGACIELCVGQALLLKHQRRCFRRSLHLTLEQLVETNVRGVSPGRVVPIDQELAALTIGLIIWALGAGTVLSFNVLSEFKFLKGTIFENLDHLTINIMLPLGGLMIAVFAGWVLCRNSTSDELRGAGMAFRLWRFLVRYVAPIGILFVFFKSVGLLPDLS